MIQPPMCFVIRPPSRTATTTMCADKAVDPATKFGSRQTRALPGTPLAVERLRQRLVAQNLVPQEAHRDHARLAPGIDRQGERLAADLMTHRAQKPTASQVDRLDAFGDPLGVERPPP